MSSHHGPVVVGYLLSGHSALSAELVLFGVFNKRVRAGVLGKSRSEQGCWGLHSPGDHVHSHSGFGLEVSSFQRPCRGGASRGADLSFHPDPTTD